MADAEFQRLTDAGNVMEAGAIREFLEAHGIRCFVRGEQHASMLGSYGAMIGFEIMVPGARFEEAQELLQAFREAGPVDDLEAQALAAAPLEGELDERALAVDSGSTDALTEAPTLRSARTAAVLSVVPSFGFAHFYTGAFGRGALLAGVELLGLALALEGQLVFLALAAAAVVVDAVGAGARVKAWNERVQTAGAVRDGLPRARLLGKSETDSGRGPS